MDDKRRNELVFVVRMWARDDADGPQWRGYVHELDSGQRFYVTGTRDIADFIDTRITERTRSDL